MRNTVLKLFFGASVFYFSGLADASEIELALLTEDSLSEPIDDASELLNKLRMQLRDKEISAQNLVKLQAIFDPSTQAALRRQQDDELVPTRIPLLDCNVVQAVYSEDILVDQVIKLMERKRLSKKTISDIRADLGVYLLAPYPRLTRQLCEAAKQLEPNSQHPDPNTIQDEQRHYSRTGDCLGCLGGILCSILVLSHYFCFPE